MPSKLAKMLTFRRRLLVNKVSVQSLEPKACDAFCLFFSNFLLRNLSLLDEILSLQLNLRDVTTNEC